jgi:trk system potassium uptake protein TrkH
VILRGQRPGDQRIRVERVVPREYEMERPKRVRRPPSPAVVLVLGFAAVILIGTLVLILPVSSAEGRWTSPLDALFTATSAVCVTGLAIVDTGDYWSGFGQAAILVMIQVGGFGFMTGSTLLLVVLVGRRSGLRDRLIVQQSTGAPTLGGVGTIVRRAAIFTVIAEGAGMVLLFIGFLQHGMEPVTAALWGVFHSISAFNNAGFDIAGGFRSLTGFSSEYLILGTLGVLIVLGGIGVAIVDDLLAKRNWARTALETKVVVLTTIALIAVGALTIGFLEWHNPATLGGLPEAQRPLNALFESVTLRTAGFSALPTGGLRDATLFVVMALMFIGGASGSTAGGIKVNTFSVLLIAIVSTVRGQPSAEAFGRRVPHSVIYRALSVALLSIAFVFTVGFGLQLITGRTFVEVLFESVSAIGTVGASTGITPDLPEAARLLLIPAMFAGRLGPLTLVLALAARARPVSYRPAVETMRIG